MRPRRPHPELVEGSCLYFILATLPGDGALDGVPPKELRGLADDLKNKYGSAVVALVAVNDGKAALMVAVTDNLTDRLSAVELVRVGAEALGGKGGGGRPDMAQAGGPEGARADAALDAIRHAIKG